MRGITLRKLIVVVCAALMLYGLSSGQATQKDNRASEKATHDGKTPPIELKEISLQYTKDTGSTPVWHPASANVIPADAVALRITAKVTNRDPGKKVRLEASLREVCDTPDPGKDFLRRLRHLTESQAPGQQLGGDRWVRIDLPVHCEGCEESNCSGKSCDKNHLGEGPHQITITGSDDTSDTSRAAAASITPPKPSSIRFMIQSVCPAAEKKS